MENAGCCRGLGGYSKGYTLALTYWREIIEQLNALRNQRGMVVLLIAHSKVGRFEDPESSPYDRYSPRLHKHAAALMSEWCDAVLFATRKMRTQSEDAGFNRKRTIAHAIGKGGGERILRCVGGPSCVAKTADADFNVLGVQMRGYHDFGVALQDPRGAIKSKGEA